MIYTEEKDVLLKKIVESTFDIRIIDEILLLITSDELDEDNLDKLEQFFIKLGNKIGSIEVSLIEFCKIYDVNVDLAIPVLRKTCLFGVAKSERNRKKNKSFTSLF